MVVTNVPDGRLEQLREIVCSAKEHFTPGITQECFIQLQVLCLKNVWIENISNKYKGKLSLLWPQTSSFRLKKYFINAMNTFVV